MAMVRNALRSPKLCKENLETLLKSGDDLIKKVFLPWNPMYIMLAPTLDG